MDPVGKLLRKAARGEGLFTVHMARTEGVSSDVLTRLVRQGIAERLEPGVYRVAGAPPTWRQSVLAACWAERGWASHRTAAALWGFDGCRPGTVEVLTPRWKRRPNPSVRVHETRLLEPAIDCGEIDGIPVTSAERTLVDLAAVVPRERVQAAYHDAVNRRIVTPDSTWRCLERLDVPGRPWVAVSRHLVGRTLGIDGVQPNRFESRLVALLLRAGLDAPATQVEIRRPDETLLARVDAAYLRDRVILECDSEQWHGGWLARQRDLRRDRELVALGYRVLRFSWDDVTHREQDVVRHVLGARAAASA